MKKFLFFAFDAFLYPYYMEREVGYVLTDGVGKITSATLSFRSNTLNGIAKAELKETANTGDYVPGIVYVLNAAQFKHIREVTAKGFKMVPQKLTITHHDSLSEVWNLVPEDTGIRDIDTPIDWYIKFMLAGAKQFGFPKEYIEFLSAMNTRPDPLPLRGDTFNDMLNYPKLIKKIFEPSVNLIKVLNRGGRCTIHSPTHGYDGRPITIEKTERGFGFSTTVQLQRGAQYHDELKVEGKDLTFTRGKTKWYTTGRDFFAKNIKYDFDQEIKIVTGSISGMGTLQLSEIENYYLRMLIPMSEKRDITHDFQYYKYLTNGKVSTGIIKLNILGNEVHFYTALVGKQHFIGIDILGKIPLRKFQETVHAVLLTFALLKGQFLSGAAYVLAFEEVNMDVPAGVLYQEMNSPIFDLPGVFTTNGFTGIERSKLTRDEKGIISKEDLAKINEGMAHFPTEIYSKLCELILSDDKVLRALIQVINNQHSTLEIKIPVQFVALETITATFVKGGNKGLKPIQDNKKADKLIEHIKEAIATFATENGFTNEDMERLSPLLKKIDTLNSPPNADKLSKSFAILDYDLSPAEKKIIALRNIFLHGSTVDVAGEDYGFKELFYISTRLQFLLAVLLLKKAGFQGKIKNYIKLWEHITEVYTDEEPLVKI